MLQLVLYCTHQHTFAGFSQNCDFLVGSNPKGSLKGGSVCAVWPDEQEPGHGIWWQGGPEARMDGRALSEPWVGTNGGTSEVYGELGLSGIAKGVQLLYLLSSKPMDLQDGE